ncbi:MAG: ABC transporter ATP-binding protein [Planctomycetes bacterium]|nr:ABC transporter ATP-binding protein [Planctomycetota bacterium]
MASIEVSGASITFTATQSKQVTLKEYLVKGLFRRTVNPQIAIHALTDISLSAKDGDRIGVIGHNGAGKTTLLKLLAGIYTPTDGKCDVKGSVCSLFDISVGFENEATGWENIVYRSYLQGESPATLKGKMDEIAEFSELGEFLTLPVKGYSAGMRMRLAFAIATTAAPEVLLVDEVLAVGDMAFQIKAKARMKSMMSSSRLMVMVSHDLNTIKDTCNRAIWMRRGKFVMEGTPKDVVAAYNRDVAEHAAAAEAQVKAATQPKPAQAAQAAAAKVA